MLEKKLRIDVPLVLSIAIVIIAGITTLYSQEVIVSQDLAWWQMRWWRQTVWVALGIVILLVFRRSNYQMLGSYALPAYGVILLLLIITVLFAPRINGARSWFKLGPVSFQASEFAKLITIILVAKYLELKEREMEKINSLVIPSLIALIPMMLIVIQPDFGGAFSFAPVLMSMLFIAGADIYYIGSALVLVGVSFSIPLYIEYHKITLINPLITHLTELDKTDLVPVVRILQNEVWKFIDSGVLPDHIADSDRGYLLKVFNSETLMTSIREAGRTVQSEEGGMLLLFLQNIELLVGLGLFLVVIAAGLLLFRYARGRSFHYLRKLYIPMGVLGIALLAATTFHTIYSFKYHQVLRILAFVNPEQFPRNHSYQIIASKTAIGSGELYGRGIFDGDMTIGSRPLVPEAFTDFIFSSWCERTGFLGSVILIIALITIPLRGLQLSFESRDRFGSLLAAGISFLLFYHIAINTMIALGLLPVTGIPLSFMSYGGSHMITCMAAAGILLSIYRRKTANQ
ncbi:MAG: rod shape-determining protein RodA [Leptospiraceae bacterium]|nr:rod shape-determining protein RodA [Leptospiraceae bacterium]